MWITKNKRGRSIVALVSVMCALAIMSACASQTPPKPMSPDPPRLSSQPVVTADKIYIAQEASISATFTPIPQDPSTTLALLSFDATGKKFEFFEGVAAAPFPYFDLAVSGDLLVGSTYLPIYLRGTPGGPLTGDPSMWPVIVYRVDLKTGTPQQLLLATPVSVGLATAFGSLKFDPTGRFLYVDNNLVTGGVAYPAAAAFTIDRTSGILTQLAGSPFYFPGGAHNPAISADGTTLCSEAMVQTGGVTCVSLQTATGAIVQDFFGLGLPTSTPTFTPDGKYLAVASGRDGVSMLIVSSAEHKITLAPGSPVSTGGSGGMALTLDPSGAFLLATNYWSADVSVLRVHADGSLAPVPGSPFPTETGGGPVPIAVSPSGRFVVVGNTLTKSLSIYSVDPATGALAQLPGSPLKLANTPVHLAPCCTSPP